MLTGVRVLMESPTTVRPLLDLRQTSRGACGFFACGREETRQGIPRTSKPAPTQTETGGAGRLESALSRSRARRPLGGACQPLKSTLTVTLAVSRRLRLDCCDGAAGALP